MTGLNLLSRSALVGSFTLIAAAPPAYAHHPASPGNTSNSGSINTIPAGVLEKGDIVFGVAVENVEYDALSDEVLAEAVEEAAVGGDPEAHIHSLSRIRTSALTAAFGVTDSLTVSARLPHVAKSGIREGHAHEENPGEFHGEAHGLGDSEGWGDLSVLGQWRFLSDEASGVELAALFGVEAPTGETDLLNAEGELFDAEFQPGSDSWDTLVGLAASRGAGRWSFDASALYTIAGDGLDANLGDRLNFGAATSYRWIGAPAHHDDGAAPHSHGPVVDLVLELSGEWQDGQTEHGEHDPNSGGTVLYLAPGVRYTNDAFSAFASAGVAAVSEFNGVQAEPEWRLVVGAGYRF